MEDTIHHAHPVAVRKAVEANAPPPELTLEDMASPSARVVALTTRPDAVVPGFAREPAHAGPGSRWVALMLPGGGACVAAALVEPAESSGFRADSTLDEAALRHSITISRMYVEPSYSGLDLAPMLAYLALRRGRLQQRTNAVAYMSDAGRALADLLDLRVLPELPSRRGQFARCQRLDIAIHRAYRAAGPRGQAVLRQGFIDEAVETLQQLVTPLLSTPYFMNLHQFVRWTTRLLGRAVSLSDDPELRGHFLNHLGGEVNHEVIIENDLAALGADVDVDYVVHAMVPNLGTQEFMVVQESLIGFHEDPVLFMAAPFAAEGFAANVTMRFITGLTACAKKWGVANPKKAVTFFASHVHFDGGDDGHWALTRDILAKNLPDDMRLQQFLNAVRLAMNGFIHCYASYVDELGIWTATPTAARD